MEAQIPAPLKGELERYIKQAIPPGDMLEAVLRNDLKEACSRISPAYQSKLWDIVKWLYHNAPIQCWGSPEAVANWRGLNR